jgi:catechol 2,3-dioxygenase-like lactoylglutathione lyase family enzyme
VAQRFPDAPTDQQEVRPRRPSRISTDAAQSWRPAVEGRIDRAAFLDAGDGRYLEVFGPGSTVQSEGRRRRPQKERTEGALLHFCLRVTDTEVAYARALAAGGVSRVAPRTAVLGQNPLIEVRIAFVTGPEGEVIEFLQSEQI